MFSPLLSAAYPITIAIEGTRVAKIALGNRRCSNGSRLGKSTKVPPPPLCAVTQTNEKIGFALAADELRSATQQAGATGS